MIMKHQLIFLIKFCIVLQLSICVMKGAETPIITKKLNKDQWFLFL
jgi:hypothetical protein